MDTRTCARNFCRIAQGRPEHTSARRLPHLSNLQTKSNAQINTPTKTTKTSSLRPQHSPRARRQQNKGCPLAHTWVRFPVSVISLPHAKVGSCQLYPISWQTSRRRVRSPKLLPPWGKPVVGLRAECLVPSGGTPGEPYFCPKMCPSCTSCDPDPVPLRKFGLSLSGTPTSLRGSAG